MLHLTYTRCTSAVYDVSSYKLNDVLEDTDFFLFEQYIIELVQSEFKNLAISFPKTLDNSNYILEFII